MDCSTHEIRRRDPLLALAGYLVLALVFFAPLLPHFATTLWGGRIAENDGWQHTWHVWWVAQALSSGQNPFVTPLLFHPAGASLYVQPLNLSNGLLVLPITLGAGPVAGYNSAAVLSFLLAGLAGYLLAFQVSGSRPAAFLGGMAFAWSPFHLGRFFNGQLELMAIQWLAFYAFFALRAVQTLRLRDALTAGVMLAITGYTSWYYLLFLLIWSALFALLWLRRPLLPNLRQWAIVGGTALLLLGPALVPALLQVYGAEQSLNEVSAAEIRTYSANGLDFWLPTLNHPLWGETVTAAVSAAWHPLSGDFNAALGYSVLLLSFAGCVLAWPIAWRWCLLAGPGMLLALGPELQLGPWNTGILLPYRLLQELPGADFARRPMLFVVLTTLALTPLVALGVRELLARSTAAAARRPGSQSLDHSPGSFSRGMSLRPALLGFGILVVLALELMPMRGRLLDAAVHPYLATLDAQDGALLHVPPPLYKIVGPQKAQMQHAAPIFGGYLARIPRYDVRFAPGINPFWQMRAESARMLDPVASAASAMSYYGLRQVIITWDDIHPDRHPLLEATLEQTLPGVTPVYADAQLSAYRVPETTPAPFAYFGDGWYPEEQNADRRWRWRWMREQGDLLLVNPESTAQRATLRFGAESYAQARQVTVQLNARPLKSITIAAQPESTPMVLHLLLPPGEHRLSLLAPTAVEQNATSRRNISIVVSNVQPSWSPLAE
jgi:hypothetical protein